MGARPIIKYLDRRCIGGFGCKLPFAIGYIQGRRLQAFAAALGRQPSIPRFLDGGV